MTTSITYTDVERRTGKTFGTTNELTSSEVTSMITDADSLVFLDTDTTEQSSERDLLVLEAAVAYVMERDLNKHGQTLASAGLSKTLHQDLWANYNRMVKRFNGRSLL